MEVFTFFSPLNSPKLTGLFTLPQSAHNPLHHSIVKQKYLLPTFELPCEGVGGVPEVSVLVPEGGALLVLAAGPHQGSAVLLHRRLHAEGG